MIFSFDVWNHKGGYYRYDEELVIPIIENTPFEEDLQVKIIIARFVSNFKAIAE